LRAHWFPLLISPPGSQSHTHNPGQVLTDWIWKEGSKVLSLKEVATLTLPIGAHDISLLVIDSLGSEAIETTKVTVRACGWPIVDDLSPKEGPQSGGDQVTIKGSGFSSATSVMFGQVELSGNKINVVDDSTITVISPSSGIAVPVKVSVKTSSPLAESNSKLFTYVGDVPIIFDIKKLANSDFYKPITVAFGPDGKLYAGNGKGEIAKFTLNEDYTAVSSLDFIAQVASGRYVMGM